MNTSFCISKLPGSGPSFEVDLSKPRVSMSWLGVNSDGVDKLRTHQLRVSESECMESPLDLGISPLRIENLSDSVRALKLETLSSWIDRTAGASKAQFAWESTAKGLARLSSRSFTMAMRFAPIA